ncbi:hypothetical protein [Pontixanthobacter sp. CEM42]|uniref:amidohydrolase family protein n=1 Tax=Pontixanthobacter sp. CEM42 TaxID=2792077 RepID=UPI001ADFEE38|nr:hypothetical protein [Pontixanthobacter sp. CEM42]
MSVFVSSRLALATGALLCASIVGASATASDTENETIRYTNGYWFNGEIFVAGDRVTSNGRFVGDGVAEDRIVDLGGKYVIAPLGDAHTHQFDGSYSYNTHNENNLRSGVFYALTTTAPASSVSAIRPKFDDWNTVDVATALGGVTGPSSHPAEIYEATALRIYGYEQQVARQAEIRASKRRLGNAYWVVESEDDIAAVWRGLLRDTPDLVKIYLRHSAEYANNSYDSWAIGGVDPALLPMITDRARSSGLRIAVAVSDISDVEAAVANEADILTHLPCYQDTSEPNLYFYAQSDAGCLISKELAEKVSEAGSAVTLIASEWAKNQNPEVRRREDANTRALRNAGVRFTIGSNAYSATILDGLIAEASRSLFTRSELLRIATIDTPQVIFPDRAIGCNAPGCEASFLALTANPLEDFGALGAIGMAVKQGRVLDLPVQNEPSP